MSISTQLRRPCRRHLLRSAISIATLIALSTAAQGQTWNGGGSSNSWNDRFNWQGGVAPVSSLQTAITFAGMLRTSPVQLIAAPFDLNSLSFAANASAFTLSGNALRFGNGGVLAQNSTSAMVIGNNVQVIDTLTYSGNGSATLTGVLSAASSSGPLPTLIKAGTGNLTLAAANTFNGRVQIEQGRLIAKDTLALQFADVLINRADGLDLSPLTQATLGGLSGPGALALGATQLTVGGNGSSPSAYTGNLSATTGTLTKVGAGTLTLGGTSTLDALRVQQGGVVLDGGSLTLDLNGDALVVGTQSAGASGGPSLALRGGVQVAVTGPTLLIDGAGGTQMVMSGAGTRISTGFQALVGIANQGRLEVGSGASFAAGNYLIAGFSGGGRGSIEVTAGGSVVSPVAIIGTLAGSQGTATVGGAGASWQTSFLGMGGLQADFRGGKGTLTVGSGGVVTVTDSLNFWGADSRIVVDGGRLLTPKLIDQPDARGDIVLLRDPTGGAALTFTASLSTDTYGGSISGAGSVAKTGSGAQVLAGSNRFTGAVDVQGGVLEMSNSAASEYTVGSFALLRLGERNLGTAVVRSSAGGAVSLLSTTVYGGRLMGSGTHDISSVQRLVGTELAPGASLVPATGTSFSGVTSGGNVNNLSGRSLAWEGGSSAGLLRASGNTELNGFRSTGVIEVLPGGVLTNRGSDLMLSGGSRTTIGSAAAPGGTLRLLDGTRVQLDGALLVNNGTLNGPLNINFGSLAKGAGVFGSVTVNDGGRFSPGNSPGLARSDSANWAAGGTYVVELASASGTAGVDWDLWALTNALIITAGSSPNSRFTVSAVTLGADGQAAPLAGFDPLQAWRWRIADTGIGVFGFDPALLTLDLSGFANATAGGSFSLALAGGGVDIVFAPVPEPASATLLLAGVAGVLAWRRRSRGP